MAALLSLALCPLPLAHGAQAEPPEGLKPPAKAAAMPAFDLPTTTGPKLDSRSLAGRVVVIRFWASWWPVCRGEMPSVQRAHERLKDNGVTVLAISIDGSGARAAKPVMDEGKFDFVAPVDQDMAIARRMGVRGVPMTYVVDRKGMIRAQGFGPLELDSEAFLEYVRSVARREPDRARSPG